VKQHHRASQIYPNSRLDVAANFDSQENRAAVVTFTNHRRQNPGRRRSRARPWLGRTYFLPQPSLSPRPPCESGLMRPGSAADPCQMRPHFKRSMQEENQNGREGRSSTPGTTTPSRSFDSRAFANRRRPPSSTLTRPASNLS
jgi:hypothetical protein